MCSHKKRCDVCGRTLVGTFSNVLYTRDSHTHAINGHRKCIEEILEEIKSDDEIILGKVMLGDDLQSW